MTEVPANIREFNETVGAVFGLLYNNHPVRMTIQPEEVAKLLGRNIDEKMPSGRTFREMFSHTMMWLTENDFLNDTAAIQPHRAVLTAKALVAMNAFPSSLGGRTLGSELIEVTKSGSSDAKNKLAELIGNLLGSGAGSFVKAMGQG